MSAESKTNVVDIGPATAAEDPREKEERDLYRLIRDSMELVGGVESAAKIMGVDRGDLRRALDRSGRYIAIEHARRLGARLAQRNPETAQRIAIALVSPFEVVVFPRVQLTAAEQARRYKQMLDAMSPACGVDLARKALETP